MKFNDIWQSFSGLFEAFMPLLSIIAGVNIMILVLKIFSSAFDRKPEFRNVHHIETVEPEDAPNRLSSTADDYWQFDDEEIDYTDWHRCQFCNQPINQRICPYCKGY